MNMGDRDALRKEIDDLAEPLLGEVIDFVRFLKARQEGQISPRMEGAIASEAVLRRFWDRPEEDEACRDL